ncbi:head-tail connector protein [Arcobacter arenosus]|uniref:Phage gp6-like head-tail connector protein n=1 Tax=Arcobacter arenosus TaxID=2576037 RepID=A0A5R8Y6B7_9BACT|nr:head-tail connector protein [Arcobacter arenosus]TLP41042.1 phage gp6-like head-tail connector protein [Arcobacter arenosus]
MLKKTVTPTINVLEEVKAYMRITDTNEDATIQMLINSSVAFAENYTNRQFGVATFEFYIDSLVSGTCLAKTPLVSVDKIEYMDDNGDYQILDTSIYYSYEEDGIGKVEIIDDIPTYKEHKYAFKITFQAGYSDIPELLMSWLAYKVLEQFDGVETQVSKFANNVLDQFKISEF